MIQIRSDQPSDWAIWEKGPHGDVLPYAPSTRTYNNVLRALQKVYTDASNARSKSDRNEAKHDDRDFSLVETAKEATKFIDSMLRYESSYPSRTTFLILLQLWMNTGSPEAGDYAEEILSRMEIMSVCHDDIKLSSNAYLLALNCWLTAAEAGRSGAAERAFR